MYINKATLLGNLTKDPELKALPSGIKVTSFSLATNRSYKDQTGKKVDQVEYHNIVAFGKPAELIFQYMKKGNSLYVEGRLQTRSWDSDQGKKYRTEILVENFQFGPKSSSGEGSSETKTWKKEDTKQEAPEFRDDDIDTIEYPQEDINAEDIPF
jgi:single-strand DNA-binding protein